MNLSTSGLMGACVGIVFALIMYIVMSVVWRRTMADQTTPAERREWLERMWPMVRMILLADFVIMGALFYYVGDLIGL